MRGTVAIIVAAFTLSACAGTQTPEKVTVTETATPSAAATTTLGHGGINDQDRVFLATLQNSASGEFFSTVPRDSLFDGAHIVCRKFDEGGKMDVLKSLLDAKFTVEQATNLMYASVTAYCPQHLTGVQ